MKKLLKQARNKMAVVPAAAAAAVMSSGAFAQIDPLDIEAAYTTGGTAVDATTAGLVGLIALVVGVGIVISLLRKA